MNNNFIIPERVWVFRNPRKCLGIECGIIHERFKVPRERAVPAGMWYTREQFSAPAMSEEWNMLLYFWKTSRVRHGEILIMCLFLLIFILMFLLKFCRSG